MRFTCCLFFFIFFVFTACREATVPEELGTELSLDDFFESYHDFRQRINPIEATKAGAYEYNDQVANYISDSYQKELIEHYTEFLAAIPTYERQQLTPAQRMSLKVMKWDAAIKLEGLRNEIVTIASPMYDLPTFELMPLAQITSLQLYFSQLAAGRSVHPFKTVKDYDDWLRRVDDYLVFLDTAMVKMQEGIRRDIVLPKVLIHHVISQLDDFADSPVDKHLFFAPIGLMPDDMTSTERRRLEGAYRQRVEEKVIPKYRELRSFLQNTYLPAGRVTDGLGALPHGEEAYKYLIRLHTSTDMTAEEIHELGLREVARIEKEMEGVKDELGFKGSLKDFLDHVRNHPELFPFSKPEEVIANFNAIHERMKPHLNRLFDFAPKGSFEVRRTEAFREASASAEYVPGTKDASRPGIFYVPIPEAKEHNVLMDEALFLHEAIPGHHFQLSLQQENEELPAFLHAEGMGVFVEGWALYAESLGRELGLYADPYQYFGMLSMEMHRAIRLVVDSGIHAKGWTRERAIQYSLEHEAESEASITSEIERYMATPGQALSYKIGQLKIRELRDRAQKQLGAAFDIAEFHRQVLNSGSLPMALLEEKIDGWITGQVAPGS